MNYEATINYLYTQLPMFQRTGAAAYKNNLENTLALDKLYNHAHTKFRCIHVAGTNGKGSVSHMLTAILQKAGYKTGLYTSPHLKDFRERIRINGKQISKKEVIKWVENFKMNNDLWKIEPSFFELTVIMAFDLFAAHKVDVAIVEVGLGGRLDSTNIINPEISIITNISLDHTALLGNTLDKIAAEKAGIIKPNVPVVIGKTQPEIAKVFQEKARETGSEIFFADQKYTSIYATLNRQGKQVVALEKAGNPIFPQLEMDLLGNYQWENLTTVLQSIEILQQKNWEITTEHIYEGLSNVSNLTGLAGRWQIIGNNPRIICDTGHNEDGIKRIVAQIENTPFKILHFIFGVVNDKDVSAVLSLLPKNAVYYFTKANLPRALNEKELQKQAAAFGLLGECYTSVNEAFEVAKSKAGKDDLIFVGGSTFVVAEIL